jgi:hypothetical protein
MRWAYAQEAPGYVKRCVAQHANEVDKLFLEIFLVDASKACFCAPRRLACWLRGGLGRMHPDDDDASTWPEDTAPPRSSTTQRIRSLAQTVGQYSGHDEGVAATEAAIVARAHEMRTTKQNSARLGAMGLVAVYACWACFAWVIFVRMHALCCAVLLLRRQPHRAH